MKLIDLRESIVDEDEVIRNCLEFIRENGSVAITNGRHIVEENGVVLNVSEYITRPYESAKWEAHKQYVDFQLVLEGEETIYVSDISNMNIGEYNPEKDYLQCHGEAKDSYVLDKSKGILLFPEDAHKPCVCNDNVPVRVKKVVFKIPIKILR